MGMSQDANILEFCKPITPFTAAYDSGPVNLDLRQWSFLSIGQIVALAMLGKSFQNAGRPVNVACAGNTVNYLQRMNFFSYLNLPFIETFSRHDASDRFLELSKIELDDNRNALPSRLRSIAGAKTIVEDTLLAALEYAFGEIIDNVLMHSETVEKGLVAAQFYPHNQYVEFCVADTGIGIPESLRNNAEYACFTDQELLLKAFDDGIGENTGDDYGGKGHGCGFGLASVKRLVQASSGHLWAVSQNSAVHFGPHRNESLTGFQFPGTIICLRIPSNVRIEPSDIFSDNFSALYNEILDSISNGKTDDILW